MPTPLLETKLRPDWQVLSQIRVDEGARLWRAVQLLSLAVMLVSLVTTYIPALDPWQTALRVLTLTTAFWFLPIRIIVARPALHGGAGDRDGHVVAYAFSVIADSFWKQSVLAGGVGALVLLATRRKGRKDAMAYGPYLALGALIVIAMAV